MYTSHLDSNDNIYVSPSYDGYTEFADLLRLGAIREVSAYIDTVGGGGGANLADGIYYRPDQDLEFVDRLPGTGEVRSANTARRTDSLPLQAMISTTLLMMHSTEDCRLVTMESSEQWMTSTHQQQMLISLGPVLISMPMLIIIRISLMNPLAWKTSASLIS